MLQNPVGHTQYRKDHGQRGGDVDQQSQDPRTKEKEEKLDGWYEQCAQTTAEIASEAINKSCCLGDPIIPAFYDRLRFDKDIHPCRVLA